MSVDPSHLNGIALYEQLSPTNAVYQYFPVSRLSPSLKPRLSELFAHRAKWILSDIEPYIVDLLQPGQTAESILRKHARILQENKIMYIAKR